MISNKYYKKVVCCSALYIIISLLTGSLIANAWNSSLLVDGGNNMGLYPSMQIQTDNESDNLTLHITYYDAEKAELKYAKARNNEVISVWEMDYSGNAGKYNSLVLDSKGQLHVSYYDEDNGSLKYIFYDNKWLFKKTVLDSEGDVGLYTSIAVDTGDNPHISYYDKTNGHLKYYNGKTGQVSVVDDEGDVGVYTSIAINNNADNDDKQTIYISYNDKFNGYLKCASSVDGVEWEIETVDRISKPGLYSSLALDKQGLPHIVYYDENFDALKYASFNASNWKTTPVVSGIRDFILLVFRQNDDMGLYCSLKLDSRDNPHISFYNESSSQINYAYFDGRIWHIEQPYDLSYSGPYNCLALDKFDKPYIAFFSSLEKPEIEQ